MIVRLAAAPSSFCSATSSAGPAVGVTLDRVQGNARLAEAPLAEEVAAALDATDKDVQIGGAGLAARAIELGLVDELYIFRNPSLVGGGTSLPRRSLRTFRST